MKGCRRCWMGPWMNWAGWKPPSTCPTATGAWTGTRRCFLRDLYWNTDNSWIIRVIYNVMNSVPTVVVCLAVIVLGLWLVRGPRHKTDQTPYDQMEEFCEYNFKEDEEDDTHDGKED